MQQWLVRSGESLLQTFMNMFTIKYAIDCVKHINDDKAEKPKAFEKAILGSILL